MKSTNSRRCLLPMMLLLCLSSSSSAQVKANVKVRVAGGGPAMQLGGQRHATTDPEQMGVFLQMRIELMKAICGLDESQVKKLALGGKSAARKLLDREPQKIGLGGLFGGGEALDVQEDSLSDEDSETSGAEESDDSQVTSIKMPTSLNEVVEQPMWKKVVKSVLSDDQRKLWADYQAEQKTKTRALVIEHRVAELEQQLCLRPDQIEAVAAVVDRVEGDQLLDEFNMGSNGFVRIAMGDGEELSKDDLKEILTETQMQVWSAGEGDGIHGMLGNILGVPQKQEKERPSELGVQLEGGLRVKAVKEDSLAAVLGIQVGDVIDSVNDEPVDTPFQLKSALKSIDRVKSVNVIRDGANVRMENK